MVIDKIGDACKQKYKPIDLFPLSPRFNTNTIFKKKYLRAQVINHGREDLASKT